jgi:N-acetyl sugar amidotransferase
MKIFWCKNCLNMSTRPRITFDSRGWCNACQWMEEKAIVDWSKREAELIDLLNRHNGKNHFDCVVAVSGGKDGSYVAHTLKTRYGVNPLCVTVRPPLSLEIGDENLLNFINSGFEHIHVSVDQESMRILDRVGFTEYGQGYYGWLIAIHTSVLRIAKNFGINLVFYSEDGEIEYGGGTARKYMATYGTDYMKSAYLNKTYESVLELSRLPRSKRYWFEFPEKLFDGMENLEVTHFSYFEPWDSYRNYVIAKENCGLKELETGVEGTFTNFAQNDQELATLHYYLMYLKFGFGRATQDAGIEIRRGSMTRDQAINLVNIYDNSYPEKLIDNYLAYYGITKQDFDSVLDKFANKDLFKKIDGIWQPIFIPGKDFEI